MKAWSTVWMTAPLAVGALACSSSDTPPSDAPDATSMVADSGMSDSGTPDSGSTPDSGAVPDAGSPADSGQPVDCDYPEGAVEPMTLNEVLFPYSWPVAIDGAGNQAPLALADVPCGAGPNWSWDDFEYILMVSVPAF